jgi:archaellin
MSATFQTIVALVIVAVAAALLLRSWFGKKKSSGCGSEGCSAVSPEIKKLQAKLKR